MIQSYFLTFTLLFSFSLFGQEIKNDTTLDIAQINSTKAYLGNNLSSDGRNIPNESQADVKVFINNIAIHRADTLFNSLEDKDQSNVFGNSLNEGPLNTRYYLTSNALPTKKGDHYVMLHLIGPEINLALANNFSLGLATTWLGNPLGMKAKYTFNSRTNTHFAIGTFLGYNFITDPDPGESNEFLGIHYAMITLGNQNSNISLSLGYNHYDFGDDTEDGYSVNGFVPNEARTLMDQAAPKLSKNDRGSNGFVGLSFMTPISKKVSFIFDGSAFIGRFKKITYSEEVVLHDVKYDAGGHWELRSIFGFPFPIYVPSYKTADFTYNKGKWVNVINTELTLSPSIRIKRKNTVRGNLQF